MSRDDAFAQASIELRGRFEPLPLLTAARAPPPRSSGPYHQQRHQPHHPALGSASSSSQALLSALPSLPAPLRPDRAALAPAPRRLDPLARAARALRARAAAATPAAAGGSSRLWRKHDGDLSLDNDDDDDDDDNNDDDDDLPWQRRRRRRYRDDHRAGPRRRRRRRDHHLHRHPRVRIAALATRHHHHHHYYNRQHHQQQLQQPPSAFDAQAPPPHHPADGDTGGCCPCCTHQDQQQYHHHRDGGGGRGGDQNTQNSPKDPSDHQPIHARSTSTDPQVQQDTTTTAGATATQTTRRTKQSNTATTTTAAPPTTTTYTRASGRNITPITSTATSAGAMNPAVAAPAPAAAAPADRRDASAPTSCFSVEHLSKLSSAETAAAAADDHEAVGGHGARGMSHSANPLDPENAPPKPLAPYIHIPRYPQHVFAWTDADSAETWVAVHAAAERYRTELPKTNALLCLAEYGARWDRDLFVLPHNALRAELVDMREILGGMARAGLSLTLGHLHDFGAWWAVFEMFLITYFNLEDAVLLPWAYDASNRAQLAIADVASAMATRRTRVERLANEIGNAFALFRCRPSGEVLPLLYRALHAFIPRLLTYLVKQEQQVARILDPAHDMGAEMERRVFDFLLTSQYGLANIVLLVRWAPPSSPVHGLVRTHVRGATRLRYQSQVKHISNTHLRIVENFKDLHIDNADIIARAIKGESNNRDA